MNARDHLIDILGSKDFQLAEFASRIDALEKENAELAEKLNDLSGDAAEVHIDAGHMD